MKKAASIIIINTDNEILLQLRDNSPDVFHPNKWGLPGGAMCPGEFPDEAIRREFFEETGLSIDFKFHLHKIIPNYFCDEYVYFAYQNIERHMIGCFEGQKMEFIRINMLQEISLSDYHGSIIYDFLNIHPLHNVPPDK